VKKFLIVSNQIKCNSFTKRFFFSISAFCKEATLNLVGHAYLDVIYRVLGLPRYSDERLTS